MIKITKASEKDISVLNPLVDQYRQFYKQKSDLKAASEFLAERFNNSESIVFLAFYKEVPAGFCQLYTSFSTVSLSPLLILNDLFVAPAYRNKELGEKLLKTAQKHCTELGYKGLALETAIDNPAQNLYERLGWKKDVGYFHYFWERPV